MSATATPVCAVVYLGSFEAFNSSSYPLMYAKLRTYYPLHVDEWEYLLERNRRPDITLNSVRQHNHFITQGNYKATCFDYRLVILRPILFQLCHKTLCTLWDPIVFTSMEYIKLNRLSVRA